MVWQPCLNTPSQVLISVDFLRELLLDFYFYNSFALSRSFHSLKSQLYRRSSPKLIERKCNILGKFNSVKEDGLQSLLQGVLLYESSAQVSLEASDKNLKSVPLYMEKIEFIGKKWKKRNLNIQNWVNWLPSVIRRMKSLENKSEFVTSLVPFLIGHLAEKISQFFTKRGSFPSLPLRSCLGNKSLFLCLFLEFKTLCFWWIQGDNSWDQGFCFLLFSHKAFWATFQSRHFFLALQ